MLWSMQQFCPAISRNNVGCRLYTKQCETHTEHKRVALPHMHAGCQGKQSGHMIVQTAVGSAVCSPDMFSVSLVDRRKERGSSDTTGFSKAGDLCIHLHKLAQTHKQYCTIVRLA